MDFALRAATTSERDRRFLREMLYEAATWRPSPSRPSREQVLSTPAVALYVAGWGRAGDRGVIAEADGGAMLGAAWYRLCTRELHGYGFVAETIPELTVGVRAEARGRGVGTALLEALVEQARVDGYPALSLSVENDNPAVRLYERLGFAPVGRVQNACTMRLGL